MRIDDDAIIKNNKNNYRNYAATFSLIEILSICRKAYKLNVKYVGFKAETHSLVR